MAERRSYLMLRITDGNLLNETAILHLEGEVIGPWVLELRRSCERWLASGRSLILDLAEVSFIDRNGIALFQELMSREVKLINCSPFLIEQLKAAISG
jgi:ABC-type transporter Mla MlaB component